MAGSSLSSRNSVGDGTGGRKRQGEVTIDWLEPEHLE